MGIRIHKCIGYGLNDLVKNDQRINPIGYLSAGWEEQKDTWTKEGFLKYYLSHSKFPIYSKDIKKLYFEGLEVP